MDIAKALAENNFTPTYVELPHPEDLDDLEPFIGSYKLFMEHKPERFVSHIGDIAAGKNYPLKNRPRKRQSQKQRHRLRRQQRHQLRRRQSRKQRHQPRLIPKFRTENMF